MLLNTSIAEFGRSPRGERGLKFGDELHKIEGIKCRSPRGERGLKFVNMKNIKACIVGVALLAESVD